MVTPARVRQTRLHNGRRPRARQPDASAQLNNILDRATKVFCEKGYEGASMRDIARATGMSLAGVDHYLGSKERPLYLIQKNTFSTILGRLRERLNGGFHPRQGIIVVNLD